ncbi:MAG: arginine--tRNA ligase [Candidatus Zophobacter franzmannii]|nr:arginine--tRNA ligase [Candidatus Zophobacter franzmannii]
MIKDLIINDLHSIVGALKLESNNKYTVEEPKDKEHGDFSTNIAMVLAKLNKTAPKVLAEKIVAKLKKNKHFSKVSIAGPGFINIKIAQALYHDILLDIFYAGDEFGSSEYGKGKMILLEFVSANPTGPLNIVNARAASFGDSLCRIMRKVGFYAEREFYINDAGNQVDILTESVELRLRQIRGENIGEFPFEAYHGEYVMDLAKEINSTEGTRILMMPEKDRMEKLKDFSLQYIHNLQINSLAKFDVEFDNWVSEKNLRKQGMVEEVLSYLAEAHCTYEKDDAIWFKSTEYGDDKDRVLLKADGTPTYIVPDIAYHLTKYQRGFDVMIDVLGPDHHGYIPRIQAAIEALKYDEDKLQFIILQQVNLFEDGEKVKMSKRLGKLVTMDDLFRAIGKDVSRFFFLQRSTNSHLNFDLELATKEGNENPVYYCQYAHARIHSILKNGKKAGLKPRKSDLKSLELLTTKEELDLIKKLSSFPELLIAIAETRETHRLPNYVIELAGLFHKYYGKFKVVDVKKEELTRARLHLVKIVARTLKIALNIMGVSAPEEMKQKKAPGDKKKSAPKKPKVKEVSETVKAKKEVKPAPKKEKKPSVKKASEKKVVKKVASPKKKTAVEKKKVSKTEAVKPKTSAKPKATTTAKKTTTKKVATKKSAVKKPAKKIAKRQ